MALLTDARLAKPDDLYERLIELHEGRSDQESAVINAKLVLLLANHIGDSDALLEAIDLAGSPKKRLPAP